MKVGIRRFIICSLALTLIFSMTFSAFAAEPRRSEICPKCDTGRILRVNHLETTRVTRSCIHGHNCLDIADIDCFMTYEECGKCDYRVYVEGSFQQIGPAVYICEYDGHIDARSVGIDWNTILAKSGSAPVSVITLNSYSMPRGVACGACRSGSMYEKWMDLWNEIISPCIHYGYGKDIFRSLDRCLVMQCNNCGNAVIVERIQTGTAESICNGYN